MTNRWVHFSHMADMGVCGVSDTLAGAFEQAAVALTAVVYPPHKLCPTETVTLYCQDNDLELLLYDWLNAVIYEMSTKRLLFSRFEVQLSDDYQLQAVLYGEPILQLLKPPTVEVKGATFTELKVYQTPMQHWVAQCVVDV